MDAAPFANTCLPSSDGSTSGDGTGPPAGQNSVLEVPPPEGCGREDAARTVLSAEAAAAREGAADEAGAGPLPAMPVEDGGLAEEGAPGLESFHTMPEDTPDGETSLCTFRVHEAAAVSRMSSRTIRQAAGTGPPRKAVSLLPCRLRRGGSMIQAGFGLNIFMETRFLHCWEKSPRTFIMIPYFRH